MWRSFRTIHQDHRRHRRRDGLLGLQPLESRDLLAATVMISEFLAQNQGGLRDARGSSPDWIEVYNAADQPVDLGGYHLTDDADNLSKWTFPPVTLDAGGYLVVFASGEAGAGFTDEQGNLHTNFALGAGGEYVALVSPQGSVLSEYGPNGNEYPKQLANVSYGIAQSRTLLDGDSQASYLIPLGGRLGRQWTQPEFDALANGFTSGTAAIGFESRPNDRINFVGQFQTGVPDQTHAVYARMEFQLRDHSAVTDLQLRLKYDNGFVAYLNGVKVAESHAPSVVDWFSTAADGLRSDAESLQFEGFDLSDHVGALVDGTNVLAIHLLNSFADDSDMLLVPELRAGFSDMSAAIGTQAKVGLMPVPTPGRPNGENELVFSGFVADTTFSVDRGFFDTPQMVEMTTETPGAEIRYTTDGSPPTASNGAVYTEPIPITTTTVLRAAAFKPGFIPSNVDTQTYIFLDDVIRQPASPPGWPTDTASWGGFQPDYEMDPEVVGPYGATIKDDLTTIPSISIVMDPEDLFGPSGIFRNPSGQGIAWERTASVELIHPDGTQGFQLNSAIRDAGSEWARRNIAKRGLRLLFKDTYGPNELPTGGPTELAYPLFSDTDIDRFDTIVLKGRADHSYVYTDGIRAQYVREHWSRDTMRDMGHVTTHGTYVHLYLNGLYWGLYAPFERPDGKFQSDYQGGDPDQWYTLNGSSGWKGDLGRDPVWSELLTSDDYETIQQYLDVDNFIDYMVVNFFTGNVDWPEHNWWAARKNEPGAKYQFFQNDTEMSFYGPHDINMNGISGDPATIYQTLVQFPEFRLRFADRVQKHFFNGGALTPDAVRARWMARAEEIDRAIVGESARWGDNRRAIPYTRDVEWMAEQNRLLTQYFPTRTDFMVSLFRSRGLFPNTVAPSFNQHGGIVPQTFDVQISAPEGTVYYTTDGSDPRLPDGAVSPTASELTGAMRLSADTTITARALRDGEWSALTEAAFVLASELPLRITEINYDPHSANLFPGLTELEVDRDRFEFVELTNTGDQPIDLSGIRFVPEKVNGKTQGIDFTFASQGLEPGQRVVVVRDREAFRSRYGATPRIADGSDGAGGEQGEYGGKLANEGEQLTLIDASGRMIQRFAYGSNDGWPSRANGKGSTLEIVDVQARYGDARNWQSSVEFGGSPGGVGHAVDRGIVINEVLAHPIPPQVDMVELYNSTAREVDITGWYLSNTEDDYFKFQVLTPTTVPPFGYRVFTETELGFGLDRALGDHLWLIASDANGRPQQFVDQIQFGASPGGVSMGPWPTHNDRWISLAAPTFGEANAGPRVGDILISEIHYLPVDPDGDGPLRIKDFEFVEIYNRTGGAIELGGWQVAGDVEFAFPAGTQIGAEETLVVVGFDPAIATKTSVFRFTLGMDGSAALAGPYRGSLDDDEGLVQLVRLDQPPANQPSFTPRLVMDEVNYLSVPPWPSGAAGSGKSLTRTGPTGYGALPSSWMATPPSPGAVDFILRHPGDANDDGQFDQRDLALVRQDSRYLTGTPADWSQGDWNGDGVFDQLDLVTALATGRYV